MKLMRPLTLDFQDKRGRRPAWPNWVLLLGGLITTAILTYHSANLFSEIESLEERQGVFERKLNRSAADPKPSAADAQRLQNELKQAHEVLARLDLPWEPLFRDVESAPSAPVALLAIEPDTHKRLITITGEAKSLEAMLRYIRSLQNTQSLTHVYLQNHHIEQKMAGQPVRFVVVASWVIKS